MNFLENLIVSLDMHLPWLLPSLEALEQAFPSAIRILACVPLATWLVYSRQRQASQVILRR